MSFIDTYEVFEEDSYIDCSLSNRMVESQNPSIVNEFIDTFSCDKAGQKSIILPKNVAQVLKMIA